jgi:Fe-S oxidoreductase
MYAETILQTVKDCRFCFMCRHVCSIGNVTLRESNTPRGFALMIDKSAMKSEVLADPGFAEAIHECTLCGACRSHCVSTHEVPAFIRAGRSELFASGQAPKSVTDLAAILSSTGNLFGEKRKRWEGRKDANKAASKAEILVYAGAWAAYKTPEALDACLAILQKLAIPFAILSDEGDTGKALLNLGDAEGSRKNALALVAQIKASGARTVVTLCPSDWDALVSDFPAMGVTLPEGVRALPSALFYMELLEKKKLVVKKPRKEALAFIDSDYLRKHHGVVDEVRVLAKALGGGALRELGTNQEESYAAGEGSLALPILRPDLQSRLAERAAGRLREAGGVALCSSPVTKATLASLLPAGALRTVDELVLEGMGS